MLLRLTHHLQELGVRVMMSDAARTYFHTRANRSYFHTEARAAEDPVDFHVSVGSLYRLAKLRTIARAPKGQRTERLRVRWG